MDGSIHANSAEGRLNAPLVGIWNLGQNAVNATADLAQTACQGEDPLLITLTLTLTPTPTPTLTLTLTPTLTLTLTLALTLTLRLSSGAASAASDFYQQGVLGRSPESARAERERRSRSRSIS